MRTSSVVCTLFEKDYHHGVAALVNSLCRNGYRGTVWAGYKGKLPPWAHPLKPGTGYQQFQVTADCSINFVPILQDWHLTWIKPDFMLRLIEEFEVDAEIMIYMDPDIVIDSCWSNIETWCSSGIAVCSERLCVPSTHPVRLGWRKYYEQRGFSYRNKLEIYINAGFVGINRTSRPFLEQWKELQKPFVGTADHRPDSFPTLGGVDLFHLVRDQYVLNAVLETTDAPISILGRDAMGFEAGNQLMFHAIGPAKPWSVNVLQKRSYSWNVTRRFLSYADSPIKTLSPLVRLFSPVSALVSLTVKSGAIILLSLNRLAHYG